MTARDALRYPIGPYDASWDGTEATRPLRIADIAEAPARLAAAVDGLSHDQLELPYRPGGWTVRQLVHHVPDSHMNAYIRCRLALTEVEPTVRPYDQDAWATLADSLATPVAVSLLLLRALHERWVVLLRSLGPADFQRTLLHPADGAMTLDQLLGRYAWHGKHHVAHITELRRRMDW